MCERLVVPVEVGDTQTTAGLRVWARRATICQHNYYVLTKFAFAPTNVRPPPERPR